jgi:hypothetical protein
MLHNAQNIIAFVGRLNRSLVSACKVGILSAAMVCLSGGLRPASKRLVIQAYLSPRPLYHMRIIRDEQQPVKKGN